MAHKDINGYQLAIIRLKDGQETPLGSFFFEKTTREAIKGMAATLWDNVATKPISG